MIKSFFILLILSLFVLTSCDPYGGYQYIVNNGSEKIVFVQYQELYNDTIFTKKVNPMNSVLIIKFESHNGLYDYKKDFLNRYFKTFSIYADSINGSFLKKNFRKREAWDYNVQKTGCLGRCGENIYTYKINNSEL